MNPEEIVNTLLNQSRADDTPDTADPFWPNLHGPLRGKPEQAEISTPQQCRADRAHFPNSEKREK